MNIADSDSYLPIADHGVIGDLRTVALVGTDGTIDWYCCPRFDSPSVFGAILGRANGGSYRIAPTRTRLPGSSTCPTPTCSSCAASRPPVSRSCRTSCRLAAGSG